MRRFARMGNLDVWYTHFEADRLQERFAPLLGSRDRARWERSQERARSHDTLQAFVKLTHVVDGERRIVPDPPLLTPLRDLPDTRDAGVERELARLMERYGHTLQSDRRTLLEQYRVADIARKVVGVGSVGTRCWIVLLLGKDDEDPLFLQAKEADESVLARHVGACLQRTQGERVVAGQRLMQATSDIFLGWERVHGIDGRRMGLLCAPVARLEGHRGGRDDVAPGDGHLRPDVRRHAGPRARARGTGSRSPPTWAAVMSSTGRWRTSPSCTPTRTSATTRHSWTPCGPAGSPRGTPDAGGCLPAPRSPLSP